MTANDSQRQCRMTVSPTASLARAEDVQPARVLGADGGEHRPRHRRGVQAQPRVRSHCRFRHRGTESLSESGMKWTSGSTKRQSDRALAQPAERSGRRPRAVADRLVAPEAARGVRRCDARCRAGHHRFWLLSALLAHGKAAYKSDLLWETLRALKRPGRAAKSFSRTPHVLCCAERGRRTANGRHGGACERPRRPCVA